MPLEIILRYVHFISIFAIVGALVSERLLLKNEMTRADLSRLARIDAVYGLAAITLLGAGLTLWLGSIGKPQYSIVITGSFLLKSFSSLSLACYPSILLCSSLRTERANLMNIKKYQK